MEEADRALALALQEEYNREYDADPGDKFSQCSTPTLNNSTSTSKSYSGEKRPKSIVDPAWELLDPSPDVRLLFQEFNAMYFWGKLSMVEVRWSPRMTLCAGLCCYEGRGGLCSIRLSKPLLQLRPRKDLVETLLHEMIHALLFVTDNNKDHDGHGPEFCKHMYRINKETGTNITIYHNFHDEVDQLRQHWWRCQGSCRTKPPYFGFVKRSMNRAPSPRDTWWSKHQMTCAGNYIKVKEPENFGKKKVKEKPKEKGLTEITPYLSQGSKDLGNTSNLIKNTKSVESREPVKSNSSGHRLGGDNMQDEACGRGIPAHSRLLASFGNKTGSIPSSSSNNIYQTPTREEKANKWESLLSTKKRNGVVKHVIRKKKLKGDITITELLDRMRRKGRKSVNADAPAFQQTPPLTNYSKRVMHFQDSQEETEHLQSDKENKTEVAHFKQTNNDRLSITGSENENMMIERKIPHVAKNEKNVSESIFPKSSQKSSKSVFLPSFDSDSEEECSLTDVLNRNKSRIETPGISSTRSKITYDDDNDLNQIEFTSSQMVTSSSKSDLNVDTNLKHNAVTRLKNGSLSKRLPSLSESDDSETFVEQELNRLKKPSNKKLKIENEATSSDKHISSHSSPINVCSQINTNSMQVDMASCPICCEEVTMSLINSHIDECLSMKAIRDSAFD